MSGIFHKFKDGLKKTAPTFYSLFGSVDGLFSDKKIDPETIDRIEEALYGADIGVDGTMRIIDEIKAVYEKDRSLRNQEITTIASSVLKQLLAGADRKLDSDRTKPIVICLVGINGSGKTTTAAKLGYHFNQNGWSTLLGACDTFRAAANEQIQSWSETLDLDLVASQEGADAAAVAYDAYQAALNRKRDILILDTAGRLHTKGKLMEELKKIRRVLQKNDPTLPHHSWLVIDGNIGSNSIEQARQFNEQFGLTGLIITKLDGTSRGGSIISIYQELKLPVYFVGLGEKAEDLLPFTVDNYVDALLGLEKE